MSHKEYIMFLTCYLVLLVVTLAHTIKFVSMRRALGNVIDQSGMITDIFTSTIMFLSAILFLEYMFVR